MEPTNCLKAERLEANLKSLVAAISESPNLRIRRQGVTDNAAIATVELDTSVLTRDTDGLDVRPTEIIHLALDERFPNSLGYAWVDHHRWLGFPHLLLGQQLCLYLDARSEWDPSAGAPGLVARVSEWFRQAVAGEFDASTALFHPVGGIPYETAGARTLVVRHPVSHIDDSQTIEIRRIPLHRRTAHRIDVAAWERNSEVEQSHPGVLVVLNEMIPLRVLRKLSSIALEIGQQGSSSRRHRFTKKLNQVARALEPGQPLHVVIAVPNPARPGEAGLHLLAAEVAHDDIAGAIEAAKRIKLATPASEPDEPDLVWLHVDDTRTSLYTRRDDARPTNAYAGRHIELWGCGALGSWIGELLVRAGVARLNICDPGRVTSGLLVRQNYGEADIGRPKAEALAERLRAINDSVEIEFRVGPASLDVDSATDLIIDATVNTLVAAALQRRQRDQLLHCPVIQIATDNETSSLGIASICDPATAATTDDVDDALRRESQSDPALTPFATFWDHSAHPPLTPTPGCSIPTFRGSGSDAATIAATALNLLATPFSRRGTGGFLFGLHSSTEAPGALSHVHLD